MDYPLDNTDKQPVVKDQNSDDLFTVDWFDDDFVAIIKFLAIPAVFAFLVLILGVIPRFVMYGFALVYGVVLLYKSSRNPEYLMACFIFYLPLSLMVPVSIVTGVNATNIFLMTLIVMAFIHRKPALPEVDYLDFDATKLGEIPPAPKGVRAPLLKFYMVFTAFSGVTAIIANGLSHILSYHLLTYKGWIDLVLLVFAFAALIKNSSTATRLVIYMMVGHVLISLLGLQEALEKSGMSTIEKSRISGSIDNPNDFGALIVYTAAPFIGMCLVYFPNLFRVMPFALQALLMARVMLATFSRGAYVALAVGALAASYVRGIKFTLGMGTLALITVLLFPQVIPDSILARLGMGDESHVELSEGPELDKSSTMRFVMWNAATEMALESPIFGKGFKMFETLVMGYSGVDIGIDDPHSMYFYLASQMGIPALVAFIFIWIFMFFRSNYVYQNSTQPFIRGIALGGAMVAACVAVFNVFGSRMVSIEVCGYAFIYALVINRLAQDIKAHRQKSIPDDQVYPL